MRIGLNNAVYTELNDSMNRINTTVRKKTFTVYSLE